MPINTFEFISQSISAASVGSLNIYKYDQNLTPQPLPSIYGNNNISRTSIQTSSPQILSILRCHQHGHKRHVDTTTIASDNSHTLSRVTKTLQIPSNLPPPMTQTYDSNSTSQTDPAPYHLIVFSYHLFKTCFRNVSTRSFTTRTPCKGGKRTQLPPLLSEPLHIVSRYDTSTRIEQVSPACTYLSESSTDRPRDLEIIFLP